MKNQLARYLETGAVWMFYIFQIFYVQFIQNQTFSNSKICFKYLLYIAVIFAYGFKDITITSGIILGMNSSYEKRRYIVTSSLNGWAHTQNYPWIDVNDWILHSLPYYLSPPMMTSSNSG